MSHGAVLARFEADPRARVVVEAIPGAGKTRLLVEASARADRALVVAYNTQLAHATQQALEARGLEARVTCLTFHALCGRCLAPARDDAQLEAAVARAERGELAPRDVPAADLVLVDEAQDVRALYVRLLRALGLAADGVGLLLAADANQLIYDFDPDHPASLEVVNAPEVALGGAWERVRLQRSHRLTAPMAAFVNAVFGTAIEAARDGPPVEVRAPRSAFGLHAALADVLEGDVGDTLLLVDRKKGNRPLVALLNALSRGGRRVHVHGVDEDAPAPGALRVSTFWAAKGCECATAVVLLPPAQARNPTYVALTRARERLVVVLEPKAPHPAAAAAAAALEPGAVAVAPGAARAVAAGALAASGTAAAECLARPSRRPYPPGAARDVGGAVPRPAAVRAAADVAVEDEAEADDEAAVRAALDGTSVDVQAAALRVALVRAELRATGRVRAMEDVLHPTRLALEERAAAVHAGLAARPVPPHASDDALLAPDLRAAATAAYAALQRAGPAEAARGDEPTAAELAAAEVALATLAWDGYDHVMRQARPVSAWAGHPRVREAVARALAALPAAADYDVPLRRGLAHARVHAADAAAAYHAVWGATTADEAAAAVRAALHPRGTCVLLDLLTGEARRVRARDPEALLRAEE